MYKYSEHHQREITVQRFPPFELISLRQALRGRLEIDPRARRHKYLILINPPWKIAIQVKILY